MSETTDQTASDAAPEQQTQTASPEAQQTEVSQAEGDETQSAEPTGEQKEPGPKPEPKPKRTDRHIAHLTARATDADRRAQEAEKRADAAEALWRASKPEGEETPPPPRQGVTQEQIRQEAARQRAEEDFNTRLGEIDATGKKELGAEAWEAAKATLTGLGAVNNQDFLQALAESENPHRLFANLADDPDTLMDLLKRPPAAMAARIGRMDAELSKPVVKSLSSAPTPAPRIQPGAAVREFDEYNIPKGMSMKEYDREMIRKEKQQRSATR